MINVIEEIVARHKDSEVVELVYRDLFQVQKMLEAGVTDQNLMAIGSISPVIDRDVEFLKALKKRNDERAAMSS